MYQSRRPQFQITERRNANNPTLLQKMMRKEFLTTAGALIITILLFVFFEQHHRDVATQHQPPTAAAAAQNATADNLNKKQFSLTDPDSVWVVVNKPLGLKPVDYVPADLVVPDVPLRVPGNESMKVRKITAEALEKMFAGAKAAGFNIMLASGYRSYSYQVGLYNGYVQSQGQASADKTSARPGHSEHQTGFAADIEPANKDCELEICFGQLPEGKWLAENAYKYGFIIRYTQDKVGVTGYEYEPWHVRYVGVELASELHKTNIKTLEEFFNVKGGESYN